MISRVVFFCAVLSLSVIASEKSYSVKFFSPAMIGGTEFKEGEYKVDVVDQKAVIRNGKTHSEFPVMVENSDSKYSSTVVRFSNGDGKLHVQEIHIGGTTTQLVFNQSGAATSAAQ